MKLDEDLAEIIVKKPVQARYINKTHGKKQCRLLQ